MGESLKGIKTEPHVEVLEEKKRRFTNPFDFLFRHRDDVSEPSISEPDSPETDFSLNDPKEAMRKYSSSTLHHPKPVSNGGTVNITVQDDMDGFVGYSTLDFDKKQSNKPRPRISDIKIYGEIEMDQQLHVPNQKSETKKKIPGTPVVKELSLKQRLEPHVFSSPLAPGSSPKDGVNFYLVKKRPESSILIDGYEVSQKDIRSLKKRRKSSSSDDERASKKVRLF
eukprot:TRINITY_DN4313_c0_g1_i2.p1 TRINITY_DN4313_c0_g1~~TRINITY_DN4313_c0_g1_i2.p1  ORF type:complete len:225 (+),score=59.18 TRINITY_DN4313_c0_g1_i2:332-1006(+)